MTNLKRYFLDQIHPQELDAIREAENVKGNDVLMTDLECLWEEESLRAPSLDTTARQSLEASKDEMLGMIGESGKRVKTRAMLLWLASAAAVVLLLFSSFLVWKQRSFDASLMSRMVETQTKAGDTTLVKMPDGTSITISGSSRFAYPMAFSSKLRKVSLSGEAYFNVAHDSNHPFVVEANGFDVTVRGTKFNLRTRPSEGHSTLWLDEGRVDIKSAKTGERQTLRPGQKAEIDMETGKVNVSQANSKGIRTSWLSHEVSFRNTPFHDVLRTVCDNYGLTLNIAKGINNLPFTGTLSNNDISEVVKTLEIVYKVKIRVSAKVMTVE